MVNLVDDSGPYKFYVPKLRETFSPFVTTKYNDGVGTYEKFSKELVIAKFQAMLESR
jgi:hypothetical protein